jgi:DNA-binding beta-propeller fold protein YncE
MAQDAHSDSTPFGSADSERPTWRKWLALALLLALLALMLYSIYYFNANQRLPIPGLGTVSETVEPPRYLYSISGPEGPDALTRPLGVTVSEDDRVFITDSAANTVRVYTVEGDYLYSFDEIADGENTTFGEPVYLVINSKDELFVTDRRHRSIYVFTLDGEYLRKIVPADAEEAATWGPLGLGVDEEDNLLVTDVGRSDLHQVIVFDENGSEVLRFGRFGQVNEIPDLPGAFHFANDVETTAGKIYVSDSNNRRVQVFDANGEFDSIVRTSGIPRGMAIDDQERLYVADALAHQADVYDSAGERVTGFGASGIGPGQFRYANDLALDERGYIFITDRLNHRVKVWGWPDEIAPVIPVVPETPTQWGLCLAPLLLLPLLLLLRRRKFAVTEDFLIAMAAAGRLEEAAHRTSWKWIVPAEQAEKYRGRAIGGVDLEQMLTFEPHSESDVADLMKRIGVEREAALVLTMGQRAKALCTEDPVLAVAARALGVGAYDTTLFVEKYLRGDRKSDE